MCLLRLSACGAALLFLVGCPPIPPSPEVDASHSSEPGKTSSTTPGDSPSSAAWLARASSERLVDLSYSFEEATVYWPTAPGFQLTHDARGPTEAGYWYASNSFCASEHGGTHLDAPFHFAENGWTTDQIPLAALVAPAVLIDLKEACSSDPDHTLTLEEIRSFEQVHGPIPDGAVVVLRTGWADFWPDRKRYLGDDTPGATSNLHFPGFSEEAARYLTTERKVAGVGLDTASLDPGNSKFFIAHQVFAAANVYGLENLDNLEHLPPTGATLVALPMKVGGGSGGPARVVAILP